MFTLLARILLAPLLARVAIAHLTLWACRLLPPGDFQIRLTWHVIGRATALATRLKEAQQSITTP